MSEVATKPIVIYGNQDLSIHIQSVLRGKSGGALPTDVLVPVKRLTVKFDYPLSNSVLVPYASYEGFALKDLIDRVCKTYQRLYWEDEETNTGTERYKTNGKYGIWGHNLNDLYIEGIEVWSDGTVYLNIGS